VEVPPATTNHDHAHVSPPRHDPRSRCPVTITVFYYPLSLLPLSFKTVLQN